MKCPKCNKPMAPGNFCPRHGHFRPGEATKYEPALRLKVKKLHPDAILPTRANDHAAGLDFYALEGGKLHPGETVLIKTGIAVEIPVGWWGFTRLRSGVASQFNLVVKSSSTIDCDYRGEVLLPVIRVPDDAFLLWMAEGLRRASKSGAEQRHINRTEPMPEEPKPFEWERGHRLFQMILLPYPDLVVEEVGELTPTARNTGGFGHTGR